MNGTDTTRIRPIWLLPCLLANLALANPAGAGAGQTAVQTAVEPGIQSAARTTYRVINLGSDYTTLPAINARGQVAFSLRTELGDRGFFYDGNTTVDIGTLGGSGTVAVALNNAGQVAGYAITPSGFAHAVVWRAGSGLVDLGTLPDRANSYATAINNRGVVVGGSDDPPFTPARAFRWSAATGLEDLGAFTSGIESYSRAAALNDAGLIAGSSNTPALDQHAFAWTRAGGMIDISPPGSGSAFPVAVGARGQVAGDALGLVNGSPYRAFLWTRASGMVNLGAGKGTESFVLAMSPNLHIAGVINYGDTDQRAMSWTPGGGMRDLGTLGGLGSRALGVNSNGQIVGAANDRRGESRAFLWSARQGMADLNRRLRHAPAGLRLDGGLAISDNGSIVASSNAGLVLLKPGYGREGIHSVGPVAAPDLVKVGAPLDASVSFADGDLVGTRGVTWSWGDGSSEQTAKVRESKGVGNASARHNYAAPGIYSVKATVVNAAGRSVAVSRRIVVYEPSGGVVGGSGSFMSPQGALKRASTRSDKASFSFIAPSNTNAQVRGTSAQLHVDLAGLSFRSNKVRAVAAKGAGAQFEGSGAINGAGDYQFSLSTTAGAATGPDGRGRFGLKIWHTDPATQREVVVYDNQGVRTDIAGGALVEGRIVQE